MGLNLFPVRAAIGTVQNDGSVLMTPEFSRALAELLERVGGETNIGIGDISLQIADLEAQPLPDQLPQEFLPGADIGSVLAEVSALRAQVEELQQRLSDQVAARADFSDLEQLTAIPAQPQSSYLADLEQLLNDPAPVNVIDWERPGRIGFRVPNSAAFTTLTASGLVTLSPANANVIISPTGTGVVTIAPATAGTMNNVAIGTVTTAAGNFTTLSASGVSLLGSTTASNGTLVRGANSGVNGGAAILCQVGGVSSIIGMGNKSALIGGAYDATAYLFHSGTLQLHGSVTALGAVVATTGFGCNGQPARVSAASGAVLSAYAAGANGLAVAADVQALVNKVIAMDAALKANGILS